jgi:phosphoglycerate dehydrogenase-like enzyme
MPAASRSSSVLPCAPFRDGMAAAVTTPWEIVATDDDLAAAADRIGAADAIVTVRYDEAWPKAPKLRLLQVPGAGYDGIDLAAYPAGCRPVQCLRARARRVRVRTPRDAGMVPSAGCCRSRDALGVWTRSSRFGGAPDDELAARRLVIVGLGRIGRAIARRARAFDMRVLAVNRSAGKTDSSVERVVSLERLRPTLAKRTLSCWAAR